MKKLSALLIVLALVLAMVPAFASEDVMTIKFWHHRGSGAQYECVTQAVTAFNETVGKEKGIVVEESYIGGYVDLFAQLQLAVQSGEAPNISSAANTYVAYMLEDDMIVDMAPLAAAEGYDIFTNQQDWQLDIGGNTDGQMHSVGYCRSTPVFMYNKTIANELGIEVPYDLTVEKMVEVCSAVKAAKDDCYGLYMGNDFGYLNAGWIYEMGSEYCGPEGSEEPACVEDGTLLKVLTDWRSWIDAGWCMPIVTGTSIDTNALLTGGQLFATVGSCASLGNMTRAFAEAGVELGVTLFPTYNAENRVSEIGGANISIIGADNSEEEIKASWEFIKFILEDEQQFFNAKTSGYIAITESVAEYDEMVKFWEENPQFKVAYDQAGMYGRGQETPYNPVMQDWTQIIWDNVSLLIAEQSITAEEALANIKADAADLWG